MDQNDLRYRLIKAQAHEMVSKRFDMIPSVLFDNACELAQNKGNEASDVLELVGSNRRECPTCDEEVEEGKLVADYECELDPDDYEDKHFWECESCNNDAETEECAYEDLPLAGPRYGGWPAAHGTCFWTTDWPRACEFSIGIVNAGEEAGFLVYEPQEFNGHILAIDGGGYDFYEAHWVPLYLALGLKWHEQDERWQEALKECDRHKRQRLNSK